MSTTNSVIEQDSGKKSGDNSTITSTKNNKSDNNNNNNNNEYHSAIEFEPPLACVRRILKHTLPSSTNVGKDACAAFARAAGIFIIYLTACANDFARENKRQTITANDVLAAVKELDFDEFLPEMTSFLESYRVTEKNKKNAKAAAVAAKAEKEESHDDEEKKDSSPNKRSRPEEDEEDEEEDDRHDDDEDDDEPSDEDEHDTKRIKTGD